MLRKISLFLMLISLFMDCSKKKDDDLLRNLILFRLLNSGNSESVSLTGGALRQKFTLTSGTRFTYKVSQASSTSSSLFTRNTSDQNSTCTASLTKSDGTIVQTIKTVPGMVDELSTTPEASGEYNISIVSEGKVGMTTEYSGGKAENSLSSENSRSKQLEGTRKYGISGAQVGNYLIVEVFEVSSINADGTPVYQNITDAVVKMTYAGNSSATTIAWNANPPFGLPSYVQTVQNLQTISSGKPIRLEVSHPTKSDLKLDMQVESYPTFVSEVKINNNATTNGSPGIELGKVSDVEFTWKNATTTKPDMVRIEVLSLVGNNLKNSYVYPKATDEKFTLKKEFLKYLTLTSVQSNDNCIGIQGGAGASGKINPNFYSGIGRDGNFFVSRLEIAGFNYSGANPAYGWVCEVGTQNPLNNNSTFSSAGLPILTVK